MLGLLKEISQNHALRIYAFCLMPNHHLVIETPQGNLLKVMHGINSGYTGYFNHIYDRIGHLFQGRYKGKLFGDMHYSAVSKSSARLEKEMSKNKRLLNLVKRLMSHVKT